MVKAPDARMQFVYARVFWENSWRVGGVQAMSDIEVEHFI